MLKPIISEGCKPMFNEMKQKVRAKLLEMASKRGQIGLGNLPTYAIALVVVAAVFIGGFLALQSLGTGLTANSYAANATSAIEQSMYNITSLLPTTGTMIGIGLFLGVIFIAFAYGRNRGMF